MIHSPTFKFKNNPALVELGGTDFQLMLEDLETTHGTVRSGFVNDGPSVNPYPLRLLVKPRTFPLAGYWHDAACVDGLKGGKSVKFTRWTADALLREAVVAESIKNDFTGRAEPINGVAYERVLKKANRKALLIWLGVRIGAKTGYQTVIPSRIKELAISEWSQRFGISVNDLDFDENTNRVYLK